MRLFFWRRKELQAEKSLTEQIEDAEEELKLVAQDVQKEAISKGEIRGAILKFVVIMEVISLFYFCVVLMQPSVSSMEKFYALVPFIATPLAGFFLFTFIKWWSYKNKEVSNSKKQQDLKETIDNLVEQLLDDPEIERRNRILIEHGKIAPTKEEERFMKALEVFKGKEKEAGKDGKEEEEEDGGKDKKQPSRLEKAVSWLLGDYRPEHNIALICGSCKFHNGFVPPKEFFVNGFSFVCYHCKKLNRRAGSKTPKTMTTKPSSSSSSSSSSVTTTTTNDNSKTETYSIDNGVIKPIDDGDDDKKSEADSNMDDEKDEKQEIKDEADVAESKKDK